MALFSRNETMATALELAPEEVVKRGKAIYKQSIRAQAEAGESIGKLRMTKNAPSPPARRKAAPCWEFQCCRAAPARLGL
jgi:hypothetical protein